MRVWCARTGRLVWHKLLAPAVYQRNGTVPRAFVAFSGDGKFVVVAGSRNDPVRNFFGSMERVGPIVTIFLADFIAKALAGGMPHGQYMDGISSDSEQHAVFPVAFAVEQNTDFFAVRGRIRVDGAALRLGAERGDFCPDAA